MKTRAHQTLTAQLWRCAFIALSLFGVNPSLQAKESSGMQWTVTRHTWGEDLSGSLQGAGGIGGLLRSTGTASTEDGKRNAEHEQMPAEHTFSYDSNGNVVLLTDTQGRESARYAYDAFGKTLTAAGPAAQINRYRFSTKPVEVESGLVYYGYRYYDPVTGRWPSRDPLKEMGGVNLYGMVDNGAINFIDHIGLVNPAMIAAFVTVFSSLAGAAAGSQIASCLGEEDCEACIERWRLVGLAAMTAGAVGAVLTCVAVNPVMGMYCSIASGVGIGWAMSDWNTNAETMKAQCNRIACV